jgi:heavy metal translocating P-type ATPase
MRGATSDVQAPPPPARTDGTRSAAAPAPAQDRVSGEAAAAAGTYARNPGVTRNVLVAALAVVGIAAHLALLGAGATRPTRDLPLLGVLGVGGTILVAELTAKLLRRQFGSDLLAGASIVTACLLGQYLAGALVVLMLAGGQALEDHAVRRASSVLRALARRVPSVAHRKTDASVEDVPVGEVRIGDRLLLFPHEVCPVDGVVVDGHGSMDESYLTGEPFRMSKTPGADVISGAVNGESALTVEATRRAADSRYARIMRVMLASERDAPRLRRLGDQLGAFYTPLAVAVAGLAWLASGDADRFLAVLVVATPCPLLIAIPVAIIGSISLAARRGIVVKKPAVLEQVAGCRTLIFDKTGTLTYGKPRLVGVVPAPGFDRDRVLALTAGLERYSKHPLAGAVLRAAADAGLPAVDVTRVSERPGEGLHGTVGGHDVRVTSRRKLLAAGGDLASGVPETAAGLECVVLVDGAYAATLRFRDEPRAEGASFVSHLGPRHAFDRLMLVSGDRASEVAYLADLVGIREVHAGKSPEEKLEIVRRETARAKTCYLGDGINDAPALAAATVGIALGRNSDITAEAAGAVILDTSLERVDEFLHIGHRMRRVALQSAIGGMLLSVAGMALAAAGYLPPVAGAVAQEIIDVFAVANALRAALPPASLTDF